MLRKTLNKIFSSRAFYIIFSLLVSIALWMYVELYVVQEQSYEISDIPIAFTYEEVLRDRGLLISSYTPQSISLTFTVPRTVAANLRSGLLTAEVNLASINSTGTKLLEYSIIYPPNINARSITSVTPSVELISLMVDQLSTVPIPVRVDYRGGTASDDLVADPPIYDPQYITLYGPDEIISRVKEARVPIFRENLSSTYTDDLAYVLLDENGEEIDDATLATITHSHEAIHITVPIKQQKDIYLNVEFLYGSGATNLNTDFLIIPQYVTVLGDPEQLRDYNSITLGTINTTTFLETGTSVFPIILQNNVTNLSGETEAQVTVRITGLETEYFSTTNLHAVNKPVDYRLEWITQSLAVGIRGKREDLNLVELSNIRVVIDLRDRTAGTHRIAATIYLDGIDANIGSFETYLVAVRLVREEE